MRSGSGQGEALTIPLYKFLKEALIRAFGEETYAAIAAAIEENTSAPE